MPEIGRVLIVVGALILVLGVLLTFAGRVPFLGRLPGDFVFRRGNATFYFPLVTSLLLSILVSALLWLFRR
jgi:hypothetical protein